jgi:hypothetical protein
MPFRQANPRKSNRRGGGLGHSWSLPLNESDLFDQTRPRHRSLPPRQHPNCGIGAQGVRLNFVVIRIANWLVGHTSAPLNTTIDNRSVD